LSKRNPETLGVWGVNGTRVVASESYWKQPLKWNRDAVAAGERRRVFCASLADVFEDHPAIQPGWRYRLGNLILDTPNLDWLLLTKRPQNVIRMIPDFWATLTGIPAMPKNVWLGVSCEDQKTADERIPLLLQTPAAVRFLSCEPLLGPIEFSDVTNRSDAVRQLGKKSLDGIHWVIAGGESGHGARPMHPDWLRSLRDQCEAAGTAFFLKQWGEYVSAWQVPKDQMAFVAGHPGTVLHKDGTQTIAYRVGKKAAGHMLDGKEWHQFPEVQA
jgi:protein gp37